MCSCLIHTCIVSHACVSHISGHLNASGKQQNLNLLLTQEGWQMAWELVDHHQLSVHVFILDYQSESLLLKLAETYEFLWTPGLRINFLAFSNVHYFTIKAYLSYSAILSETEKGKFNGMCKIALVWLMYIILKLDSAQ